MNLKWEYTFDSEKTTNLVAKLKTESGCLIFLVYENSVGFSTVVSDTYRGFIHSNTCCHSDIDIDLPIFHIPATRENKIKYACVKLEESFLAQRNNIAEKLYLKNTSS